VDGRPDFLLYLFPVLWIAAATVVALLLYRTSRAFVQHGSAGDSGTKRVRLVGSIAIAVVSLSERKSRAARRRYIIALNERLELVTRTDAWNVFRGVPLEEHRQHSLTILPCVIGLGMHTHPIRCSGSA